MKAGKIFVVLTLLSSFSVVAFGQGTVTRTMSLNPYGMNILQDGSPGPGSRFGAGFGASGVRAGIVMPDPSGGSSRFSMTFTLPHDYAAETPLQLRVVWRSEAISCVVDLRNNFLYWAHPGIPSQSGSFQRESTMLAPNSVQTVNETFFNLAFVNMPLEAGATIGGGLFRTSALDSCRDDLYVVGLSIVYQGVTEGVFADGFER